MEDLEIHSQIYPDSSSAPEPIKEEEVEAGPEFTTVGGGYRCPECHVVAADEAVLAAHLLSEHHLRLIVSNEPPANQVLGSTGSSGSTSPVSESKGSNCPVCRQTVENLPQHFATTHTSPGVEVVAATGASSIVPIVLPSQPLPSSHLRNSSMDSPLKLQENLKAMSKIPVNNYNSSLISEIKKKLGSSRGRGKGARARDSEAIDLTLRNEANNNDEGEDRDDSGNEDLSKKRRRKQTSVPEQNKDQRYWARRLKNNEAAKRSRDMRIQREKIIFDENQRLEAEVNGLRAERNQILTDNKELKLKMEFVLEENARLKSLVQSIQESGSSSGPNSETGSASPSV